MSAPVRSRVVPLNGTGGNELVGKTFRGGSWDGCKIIGVDSVERTLTIEVPVTDEEVEAIARVIYEANRAYCATLGDFSFGEWKDAQEWQKQTLRTGIRVTLAGEVSGPEASHESWMREKVATGWVYGPVKDSNATPPTHPCMVPYDELPPEQRRKDHLFLAIVHALTRDIG
jgi:hypothetical protein